MADPIAREQLQALCEAQRWRLIVEPAPGDEWRVAIDAKNGPAATARTIEEACAMILFTLEEGEPPADTAQALLTSLRSNILYRCGNNLPETFSFLVNGEPAVDNRALRAWIIENMPGPRHNAALVGLLRRWMSVTRTMRDDLDLIRETRDTLALLP